MRRRQYVFVAMPFAAEHQVLYRHQIKPAIKRAGFTCARVDEIPHNRPIQDVIFELVEKSKLVVFVADGGNPNAYYEAGFADAMRKEVVIVARSLAELKFDIANRHTITYQDRDGSLALELEKKLIALRHFRPFGV